MDEYRLEHTRALKVVGGDKVLSVEVENEHVMVWVERQAMVEPAIGGPPAQMRLLGQALIEVAEEMGKLEWSVGPAPKGKSVGEGGPDTIKVEPGQPIIHGQDVSPPDVVCPRCNNDGRIGCQVCHGLGHVYVVHQSRVGAPEQKWGWTTHAQCSGEGCDTCNGTGRIGHKIKVR